MLLRGSNFARFCRRQNSPECCFAVQTLRGFAEGKTRPNAASRFKLCEVLPKAKLARMPLRGSNFARFCRRQNSPECCFAVQTLRDFAEGKTRPNAASRFKLCEILPKAKLARMPLHSLGFARFCRRQSSPDLCGSGSALRSGTGRVCMRLARGRCRSLAFCVRRGYGAFLSNKKY